MRLFRNRGFMKVEAQIQKTTDKLEELAKSHSLGRKLVFPLLKNALGFFLLLLVISLIAGQLGYATPQTSQQAREGYTTFFLLAVGLVSFFEVFSENFLKVDLMHQAFKLGMMAGRQRVAVSEKRSVDVPVVQVNRQRAINEDVNTILNDYFSTNITPSRDRAVELLANRTDNSRSNNTASAKAALLQLLESGIIKKGAARNSPLEVTVKTKPEAISEFKKYLRSRA